MNSSSEILPAGELIFDDYGVTGTALNMAFRLLDAGPFKTVLAESADVLALITSAWFFEEVVRHSTVWDRTAYRPIRVVVKETDTIGWIRLPDSLCRAGETRPDPLLPSAHLAVYQALVRQGWIHPAKSSPISRTPPGP